MIEFEMFDGDRKLLKQTYGCFPSGVAAIGALVDSHPLGMVASSFTSVSLEPSLVSICFQNASKTWQKLRECRRLGVSILADTQRDSCVRLAGHVNDRFTNEKWDAAASGAVFIRNSVAWLDCSLQSEVPAGDHVMSVLRIHGLRAWPEVQPLVFHGSQYRSLGQLSELPTTVEPPG